MPFSAEYAEVLSVRHPLLAGGVGGELVADGRCSMLAKAITSGRAISTPCDIGSGCHSASAK